MSVTEAPQDPGISTTPAAMLREPANQVSTKAPVLWAAGATFQALWVPVILVLALVFDWFDVPLWLWPLYAVLAVAYIVAMPMVRYRIHRWESTDTAVYTQTGWLSRERRIAPMSRVQTVDFEQSAIGRVLGLASVTVTTASAAGPLVISMIDKPVADRLVDDLTRRTEAEAGDAT
ncbi:MAG: Bacterial rane flanked domain protein [Marmoricola sp.]|nr:Bacterial rane flanked domain protein [Marmoricola sp.]